MRTYPEPWDESQSKQVEGLLTAFISDKRAVAAVMGCKVGDLDWLCRQAFDKTFSKAAEHFALIGDAQLKSATFKLAVDGNAKMLETLNRERGLTLGPVERRRKVAKEAKQASEETDF